MSTDLQYLQYLPVEEQPSKDELIAFISAHLCEVLKLRSYKTLATLYYKILLLEKQEIDHNLIIDSWLHAYQDDEPSLEFNVWGGGPGQL